jgi:ArsR family transcriptional regulator, nickel/cobalt-responsive transcriptional repressor
MGHFQHNKALPLAAIDVDLAEEVAETMQALAAPSRVRILARLRQSPCSVTDLAGDVGLQQSAVSHQLRLLRHLGLVIGRRDGNRVIYSLHDDHVGDLLAQAIYHVEHMHLAAQDARASREKQTAMPTRRPRR